MLVSEEAPLGAHKPATLLQNQPATQSQRHPELPRALIFIFMSQMIARTAAFTESSRLTSLAAIKVSLLQHKAGLLQILKRNPHVFHARFNSSRSRTECSEGESPRQNLRWFTYASWFKIMRQRPVSRA